MTTLATKPKTTENLSTENLSTENPSIENTLSSVAVLETSSATEDSINEHIIGQLMGRDSHVHASSFWSDAGRVVGDLAERYGQYKLRGGYRNLFRAQ